MPIADEPSTEWEGFVVRDFEGSLIKVGTEVRFEDTLIIGKVTAISDPDADYDDNLGRAVQYPPRITVQTSPDTTEEYTTHDNTPITWADYPDGPKTYIFIWRRIGGSKVKVGDRVRWKLGVPSDSPEHNGKLISFNEELQYWSVRWDDGTEELCDVDGLEIVNA